MSMPTFKCSDVTRNTHYHDTQIRLWRCIKNEAIVHCEGCPGIKYTKDQMLAETGGKGNGTRYMFFHACKKHNAKCDHIKYQAARQQMAGMCNCEDAEAAGESLEHADEELERTTGEEQMFQPRQRTDAAVTPPSPRKRARPSVGNANGNFAPSAAACLRDMSNGTPGAAPGESLEHADEELERTTGEEMCERFTLVVPGEGAWNAVVRDLDGTIVLENFRVRSITDGTLYRRETSCRTDPVRVETHTPVTIKDTGEHGVVVVASATKSLVERERDGVVVYVSNDALMYRMGRSIDDPLPPCHVVNAYLVPKQVDVVT